RPARGAGADHRRSHVVPAVRPRGPGTSAGNGTGSSAGTVTAARPDGNGNRAALAGAPAGLPRPGAAHCQQAPFMYEMKGAWSCQDRRLGPGLGTDLPGSPAVFPASTRRPQNPGSYPQLYPQLVDSRPSGLMQWIDPEGLRPGI